MILALLCAWASPAAAQPRAKAPRDPDIPQMSLRLGYGDTLWPNRWTPITVVLDGGTKAFEGELSIVYAQSDQLGARVLRRVTATPGKTSFYPVLVSLPTNCRSITIDLHRLSGRSVQHVELSPFPDLERNELPLPAVMGSSPIVLAIGEPNTPCLIALNSLADPIDNRPAIGVTQPVVCPIQMASLPPSWAALDSVLLAVVSSEAARGADPRTLAALREWVSAGGRLVIIADVPGEGWRDWLRGRGEPLPFDVGPVRNTEVPPGLSAALEEPCPEVTSQREQAMQNLPQGAAAARRAQKDATARTTRFTVAPQIAGRQVTVTPEGERAGWRLRPDAGSLVAEGPFGFGWVVVLGFDPQRVPEVVASESTRRVWYPLLDTALADFRARTTLPSDDANYATDSFSTGGLTVSDSQIGQARIQALNKISDVPEVGGAFFPVLAAGLFVLALLVGPVDAISLRLLRARHRSWATALGWIGLASLLAYLVPGLVRSGPTLVNRLSAIDILQLDPSPDSDALAWQTSLSGVFAGRGITDALGAESPGAWWRSTSADHESNWGYSDQPPRRRLTTVQSLPDLSSLALGGDPWSGFSVGAPGSGGNIPTNHFAAVWTFHTFQDQGRTTSPLRATVHRRDSGWHVELHSLPAGASLTHAMLRVADGSEDRWHTLSFETVGTRLVALATGDGAAAPDADWFAPQHPRSNDWQYQYGQHLAEKMPAGTPFLLPGPDRRTNTITRLVRSGHAVVYAAIENTPPGIRLAKDARAQATQHCRIVTPLAPPQEQDQ